MRVAISDPERQLLAMFEAEVGALVEYLPVPLLVTSETGKILRANDAAELLLGIPEGISGQHIDDVLRCQAISVRVRLLRHAGEVLRLYVLHDRS